MRNAQKRERSDTSQKRLWPAIVFVSSVHTGSLFVPRLPVGNCLCLRAIHQAHPNHAFCIRFYGPGREEWIIAAVLTMNIGIKSIGWTRNLAKPALRFPDLRINLSTFTQCQLTLRARSSIPSVRTTRRTPQRCIPQCIHDELHGSTLARALALSGEQLAESKFLVFSQVRFGSAMG